MLFVYIGASVCLLCYKDHNTTNLILDFVFVLLFIKMGLFGFGGSSSGDTSGQTSSSSGGLDLSGYSSGSSDAYSSKMRSPSSSDYDFSSSSSSFDSMSSTSGDVQATIQAEQQKLQLMSAVSKASLHNVISSDTFDLFY